VIFALRHPAVLLGLLIGFAVGVTLKAAVQRGLGAGFSFRRRGRLRAELKRVFGVDLTKIPGIRTGIAQLLFGEIGPDFHPVRNRANRYRQDRAAMRTSATAGFGRAFEVHDTWAVEAPGAIQDRTKEHLGYSDRSVIMLRRVMQDAISAMQRGEPAPELGRHGTADVSEIISVADVVPAGTDGPAYLQQQIAARLRRIGAVAHG